MTLCGIAFLPGRYAVARPIPLEHTDGAQSDPPIRRAYCTGDFLVQRVFVTHVEQPAAVGSGTSPDGKQSAAK